MIEMAINNETLRNATTATFCTTTHTHTHVDTTLDLLHWSVVRKVMKHIIEDHHVGFSFPAFSHFSDPEAVRGLKCRDP